jgi:hypothetical protein
MRKTRLGAVEGRELSLNPPDGVWRKEKRLAIAREPPKEPVLSARSTGLPIASLATATTRGAFKIVTARLARIS